MTHKLKTLGLVLGAVFVMNSVAASLASAEETKAGLFTANIRATETMKFDIEQIGVGTVTLNGLSITCGSVTGSGKALTKGPSSTEITIEPTLGPNNCHVIIAGLTKTVTVTMNGCATVYNAKTTVTKTGFDLTATVTFECPSEKQMEVHIYKTAASEAETLCTYDIKPQGPLTGISFVNHVNTPGASDDIVSQNSVIVSNTNTIKSALCGQNSTESSVIEGEGTVRVTDELGNFVDASISS